MRGRAAHTIPSAMQRYLAIFGATLAFFLLLFLAFEALGVPLLDDPAPWLAQGGLPTALLGVGLLLVDVALPVPSNVVMVAHGALFGVALGTMLSLVGSLGAALIAFGLGRCGEQLIGRLISPASASRPIGCSIGGGHWQSLSPTRSR
jgi:uncharacterized membrane protein YdjX (TVP38/TMEM64 family)